MEFDSEVTTLRKTVLELQSLTYIQPLPSAKPWPSSTVSCASAPGLPRDCGLSPARSVRLGVSQKGGPGGHRQQDGHLDALACRPLPAGIPDPPAW
ncbi:hypothetical protein BASA82_000520 [Batrachochytrium salamandrivorans]|nr:hypothetical protein BASA82_000520 [Batrachochytrium salamandrivorans]